MDNYAKGKNVEEPLEKGKIPIPDLPAQFIWMQVNGGSKMRNLLGYAMKVFKDEQAIVWSGSGAGMGKAISCAEIMKRRNKQLHQINRICYRRVEEFWDPLKADLDPLIVVREVPTIHILLSKEPLNTSEPGYQTPYSNNFGMLQYQSSESKSRGNRANRVSSEQFEALGLRSRNRQKQRATACNDWENFKPAQAE